jgi:hypothetical protein
VRTIVAAAEPCRASNRECLPMVMRLRGLRLHAPAGSRRGVSTALGPPPRSTSTPTGQHFAPSSTGTHQQTTTESSPSGWVFSSLLAHDPAARARSSADDSDWRHVRGRVRSGKLPFGSALPRLPTSLPSAWRTTPASYGRFGPLRHFRSTSQSGDCRAGRR